MKPETAKPEDFQSFKAEPAQPTALPYPGKTKSGSAAPAILTLAENSVRALNDGRWRGLHINLWSHARRHGLESILFDLLHEMEQIASEAREAGSARNVGAEFVSRAKEAFSAAGQPYRSGKPVESAEIAEVSAASAAMCAEMGITPPPGSLAHAAMQAAPPPPVPVPAPSAPPAQTQLFEAGPEQEADLRQERQALKLLFDSLSARERGDLEQEAFAQIKARNRFLTEQLVRHNWRWEENKVLRESTWPYIAERVRERKAKV